MADHRRGRAAAGRDGQGHHPRRHRQDRHRRRPGLRHRVPRRGHPRAVHGGPDDGLQHVDRGRRPRRDDRARRDDLRLPPGPRRTRPTGADWDAAVAYWRELRTDDDADLRRRGRHRRRRRSRRSSPGAPTPGRGCRSASRVPDPEDFADESERAAAERALEYMGLDRRHAAARDRGRHGVPRLVHQRPHRGPARRRRGHQGPPGRRRRADARRARLGAGPAAGRGRGPGRGLHRGRRRVAAAPAARCAWA